MSKKQKLFHSTVTFAGVGEARIDNLTQEQAWQIQDVCRLIERKPPNYSANGDLLYHVTTETADSSRATTARGGFLTRLMRRFNAWAMGGLLIIALLLVAQEALAQEPRALEPIKVSVSTRALDCPRFEAAFRAELSKHGDVAIAARKADFEIYASCAELRDDDGAAFGYSASLWLADAKSKDRYHSTYVGRDAALLARRIVEEVDKEFFQPRRKGK